jgi:eukaryotic-like serine/threonine-protein kinase
MRPAPPRPDSTAAPPGADPWGPTPPRIGVVGAAGAELDKLVTALAGAGLRTFRVPVEDSDSLLSLTAGGALEPASLVVILANADAWTLRCRALAWLGGNAGSNNLLIVAPTAAEADAIGVVAERVLRSTPHGAVTAVRDMLVRGGHSGNMLTPAADTLDADALAVPKFSGLEVGDRVGRFHLRRCLGEGGMGVVFEAEDTDYGQRVALKVLIQRSSSAIDRIKREFRLASTLSHPHLLPLYELGRVGGTWFFTMKRVRGDHLDLALARANADSVAVARAFRQLAAALHTMHLAGLVHLDVKPTNVLVQADGHLYLLDYGIARDTASGEDLVVGTPGFIAPELLVEGRATPACDWYSVGATLHQVLTGAPPRADGLDDERLGEGPLASLCADLLVADPDARPLYHDVIARLAGAASGSVLHDDALNDAALNEASLNEKLDGRVDPVVLGRGSELDALTELAVAAQDGPVVLSVQGPSGMGKSALVHQWIDQMRVRFGGAVLSGRCFERESIPYQAMDGVVTHLRRALELDGRGYEPRVRAGGVDLSRLFSIFAVPAWPPEVIPEELVQGRAQAGLSTLLDRIADPGPLLVVIEDVHWGDGDSGRLLAGALRRRPDLPVLVVTTSRTAPQESPFLRELDDDVAGGVRTVELQPLDHAAASELLRRTAGGAIDPKVCEAALDEAEGNPWLLAALGRAVRTQAAPRVADVVRSQLAGLDPGERRVLDIVAVAAQPTQVQAVLGAADLNVDVAAAVSRLCSLRLLHARGLRRADTVECYHDRIRGVVAAELSPDALRSAHAGLAAALTDLSVAPARLARHFYGAGEADEAIDLSRRAAQEASEARAHLQAAHLWGQAATWSADRGISDPADHVHEARCLALAGHRVQAADCLLALQGDHPSMLMQREAAEHLLASGEVARGETALQPLLKAHGIRRPRGALGLGVGVAFTLLRLALLDRDQSGRAVRADLAERAGVCRAASKGLLATDSLQGLWFAVRGLSWALRSGDQDEAVRSLAVVGSVLLLPLGGALGRWGERMLGRAERRASDRADPVLMGVVAVGRAQERLLAGDWAAS